jgi:hypothetical protein
VVWAYNLSITHKLRQDNLLGKWLVDRGVWRHI